jgi:hypothetical protein
MKKFKFYSDRKITTWVRKKFEVGAESLEDAIKISITVTKDGSLDTLVGWEEIKGGRQIIKSEGFDDESTQKLFYKDNTLLYQNGEW